MPDHSLKTIRLIEEKANGIIEGAKAEVAARLKLGREKELERLKDLELSLQKETTELLSLVKAKTEEEAKQLEESGKKEIAALERKIDPAKTKTEILKWLS